MIDPLAGPSLGSWGGENLPCGGEGKYSYLGPNDPLYLKSSCGQGWDREYGDEVSLTTS